MYTSAIACSPQVIPISRQHQLLETVRGRLSDRSSVVRRNAIILLTSFLTCNPYAARVSGHNVVIVIIGCAIAG